MSISIDSFGNLYNQTTAAASNSSADKLSDTLSGDLSNASDEELMDVCKDFEAYFVEQVFKEMKKWFRNPRMRMHPWDSSKIILRKR